MPSATARQLLGRHGERLAAEHLQGLGWQVVGTGFLARRGEVDLVCRRGSSLVLVEVKTRSGVGFGLPAEAVGARKRRALSAAAAEYRALAGWRGEIRFAVVSVLVGPAGEPTSIELIEDPF
jgi:putative endonuclease